MDIKRTAVIGAGVMGSGIAAHLANAGCSVELLDIVPAHASDRDMIATGALARMLKTSPAPLMHKSFAKRIRPGNLEDHLDRLSECDLIIEAVIEDIGVKSTLYKKIESYKKPSAIVASNTSTIPLHTLMADQSESFRQRFMITHFFNPPRYMPLLELVISNETDPDAVQAVETFMDLRLGKGVVRCFDTPGFIANRIGTFWIQCAINLTHDLNLRIEEADAIAGPPMGIPRTGVFGLVDLVGLDLMPHISKSLLGKLPPDDAYAKIARTYPIIEDMIKAGYTGRKGKGGFYRLNDKKEKMVINLKTGQDYLAPKAKPEAVARAKKGGLHALVETPDAGGRFAWELLKQTLLYVLNHASSIAGDIVAVDTAMKLGYNWKWGPFEIIDRLGTDYFISRLQAEGQAVPSLLALAAERSFYRIQDGRLQYLDHRGAYQDIRRPGGVLLLSDIKRASKPIEKNISAALWDLGDGILCFEFTSKMNTLDFFTMRLLNRACDRIEKGQFKALVIHNEGDDFSVGANIGVALYAAKFGLRFLVDLMVRQGQKTYKRLKYASFPVVSAPAGKALGGGCEILLHSHHVQAHAETYPGLVEVGVGLLPAWGGCTELLTRALRDGIPQGKGPMPAVAAVFETISTAKVGLSAFEAQDLLYFRSNDGVTMNRQRLLADAKAKALVLLNTHKVEAPFDLRLPGLSGRAALDLAVDTFYLKGAATPYDVVVSHRVAHILTGGDNAGPGILTSQEDLRALEREGFLSLFRDARTLARITTILKTGKPLREPHIPGLSAAQLRSEAVFYPLPKTDSRKKDTRPIVNWPALVRS